jgi:cytochrome c-type biogenesis protein CcmH/NrfG
MAPAVGTDRRRFLERSLADLDREYDAGDLDRRDYERLRADYERRLRGEDPPPRPPAKRSFVVASIGFVVVVAVAAGVLVAQSIGRREDGDSITGNAAVATVPTVPPGSSAGAGGGDDTPPAEDLPADLARCTTADASEAIGCFTSYTQAHPDDAQGFEQFGLFAVRAGMQSQRPELFDAAETFLRRALDLDPDSVEARVYLAVLLNRTGRTDEADIECAQLAAVDVPDELTPLVNLACS